MGTQQPGSGSNAARVGVLLGAILVQLILGTVYGYSIFWQPLTAEIFPEIITESERVAFVASGGDAAGVVVASDDAERADLLASQQGYLKYAFSICILSFAFVMVIAGRIQDITGPRLPAMVGAVLMGLGFLLAGLMNHPAVFYIAHAAFVGAVCVVLLMVFDAITGRVDAAKFPLVRAGPSGIIVSCAVAGVLLGLTYVRGDEPINKIFLLWGTIGFLAGAGIGFAYVCPIAALVKWFPKHKGLVSGIAVAGFGFGAFLFKGRAIGALGFIETHGIRPFFLIHAGICFVGVMAGSLLLRNPPSTRVSSGPTTRPESGWQDTLRRPAFLVLWLMFFSGAMAGLMVIGIIKVFAGEQLVAAAVEGGKALTDGERAGLLAQGAAAVGWLAIFNAVGRVMWGLISDMIGRTTAFVAMFVAQAFMMFFLGSMQAELSLAVAASIVGFNFGGNFALFPSATADLFGSKNLGANYGWVFTSYGLAGVVGIAAGNAAKSMTGSYTAAFVVAGVLCLISAALAIGLSVSRRRLAASG